MKEANLASVRAAAPANRPDASDPSAALTAEGLLDILPIAAYICDIRGRIVCFNERAVGLWGRRPRPGDDGDRFCGAHRLYRPDGEPLLHAECPMAAVLRDGNPVHDAEILIEQPDGRRVYGLASIDPIRSAAGDLIGAINCFQDITARREAEEAVLRKRTLLQEQERRFRSLLEALPLALYTTDAAGKITFYNEAAAAFWGVRPELGESEWCGSWRLYWPDGRPMAHAECPMAVTLTEHQEVRAAEAFAERPDGTRVPFMPFPTLLRDSAGEVSGAVNVLVDITHRKQAEDRLHLLVNELNHRVKNALATVQSIAALTLRDGGDAAGRYELFEARLAAMSRAHDLLARHNWTGATLGSLLSQEIAPYREAHTTRFRVTGEEVPLGSHTALALAMIFHELAANAAKHGALSCAQGRVEVCWETGEIPGSGAKTLVLDWRELNGPQIAPPARKGFGSRLIERSITGQLGGRLQLDYEPGGLRCRMELPLNDRSPA